MSTMIETLKLSRSFGSIVAVDDLSFKVAKGEVLGFLGPNGAGKSTTMKMLTCFLTPSSGTARIGDYDVIEDPMQVRSIVGYLPESAPAYAEMTTGAFLKFVARIRGYRGAKAGDLDALAKAVCALSQLAARNDIHEADINPVLVRSHGQGIIAVDGLVFGPRL